MHHDAHDDRGGGKRHHDDSRERQADREHHHEDTDDLGERGDELRHGLVQALAEGVYVVRDAGEHVALAVAVEVAHRHDGDLLGDLLAHAVADLLRDTRHEPTLDKVAGGTREVEAEQEQERLADPVEVDRTGALDLGDEALVELGRHLAEDLRAHDVEDDRAHRERDGEEHGDLVPADVPEQLADGAREVLGLLAATHGPATAHRPALAPGGSLGLVRLACH